MTLKWHYFVSRFALWLSGVLFAFYGVIMLLAGSRARGGSGLTAILLGLVCCGLAVLSVYSAVQLIKWHWSGVTGYKALLVVGIASGVITLFTSVVSGIVSIASSGLMLYLVSIYYDKRSNCFDLAPGTPLPDYAQPKSAAGERTFTRPLCTVAGIAALLVALYWIRATCIGIGNSNLPILCVNMLYAVGLALLAAGLLSIRPILSGAGATVYVGSWLLRMVVWSGDFSLRYLQLNFISRRCLYNWLLLAAFVLLAIVCFSRSHPAWMAYLAAVCHAVGYVWSNQAILSSNTWPVNMWQYILLNALIVATMLLLGLSLKAAPQQEKQAE